MLSRRDKYIAWGLCSNKTKFLVGCMLKKIVTLLFLIFFISPTVLAETDEPNNSGSMIIQNDFSEYMARVQAKIQKNWNPPDFVEGGEAVVMFKVSRQGDVLSTSIVQSSNNELFDESTLEALRKASPFDRFPANSTRNMLTVKYTFHTTIVKTDKMQEYVDNADRYFKVDNERALSSINKAIDEVEGDSSSYFLYSKRANIRKALGDYKGADTDFAESERLKARYDQKRINTCKLIAEMDKSPFSYFYLAHSYEIAGDYEHALEAIDKAIELTELNNQYKRYRLELEQKSHH